MKIGSKHPKVKASIHDYMDLLPFTQWADKILEGTEPDGELIDLD